MASSRPTQRFSIPKVLAVTLLACGPNPSPPPDGGPLADAGPMADAGPVDCSNPYVTDGGYGFRCACCEAACGSGNGCGAYGSPPTLCECLV